MDLQNVQVQSIEVLSILSEIEVDLIKLYRRLYKSGHESYKDKLTKEISEHIKTREMLKRAYAARAKTVKYLIDYVEKETNDQAGAAIDTDSESAVISEHRVVERGPKHTDSPD
jgi:phosphoribosylanthranilate isomerase